MHRCHHVERGHVAPGPLIGHHEFRDDADHPAVPGTAGVCQNLHQPDVSATIDQAQPTRGEFFAQEPGHLGITNLQAGTGAAKHTDIIHGSIAENELLLDINRQIKQRVGINP